MRDKPLHVHDTEASPAALRSRILNWEIRLDLSRIPYTAHPFMRYHPISVGISIELNGGKITPTPAEHVALAVGYHLDSAQASFVFTGDTTMREIQARAGQGKLSVLQGGQLFAF